MRKSVFFLSPKYTATGNSWVRPCTNSLIKSTRVLPFLSYNSPLWFLLFQVYKRSATNPPRTCWEGEQTASVKGPASRKTIQATPATVDPTHLRHLARLGAEIAAKSRKRHQKTRELCWVCETSSTRPSYTDLRQYLRDQVLDATCTGAQWSAVCGRLHSSTADPTHFKYWDMLLRWHGYNPIAFAAITR